MITTPTATLKAGFMPSKKNDRSANQVITPSANIIAPKTMAIIPSTNLLTFMRPLRDRRLLNPYSGATDARGEGSSEGNALSSFGEDEPGDLIGDWGTASRPLVVRENLGYISTIW